MEGGVGRRPSSNPPTHPSVRTDPSIHPRIMRKQTYLEVAVVPVELLRGELPLVGERLVGERADEEVLQVRGQLLCLVCRVVVGEGWSDYVHRRRHSRYMDDAFTTDQHQKRTTQPRTASASMSLRTRNISRSKSRSESAACFPPGATNIWCAWGAGISCVD